MKQITKMSRLAGELEKMFNELNRSFFNGELDTPIITLVPTSRAYAHYTVSDAWLCKGKGKREINISTAYLYRPLEEIAGSLLHEMVHMHNDTVLGISDCSNKGMYHNRFFKAAAEAHGLICSKGNAYTGWSRTEPSDELILWLCEHDEFRDIEIFRAASGFAPIGTGARSTSGGDTATLTPRNNSRRYHCPKCNAIIRATRAVNMICGDCLEAMIEG